MPIDNVLPHDLDDIYGPGAEDANGWAIREGELIGLLDGLLEQFISSTEMTDTYCDVCETHAHKHIDNRGNWTGAVDAIKHKEDCIIGKVKAAIARAEGE